MILNTGNRTDIPAFYSEWFMNRVREGYVLARNPFYPEQIIRYSIDINSVDLIVFCTKNPGPMLQYMEELSGFQQFWHVTITPYDKDIEPGVPDKNDVLERFRKISDIVGKRSIGWRYDPIFISDKYSMDLHLGKFEEFAAALDGYTEQVVISFIDLFEKTRRNFPEVRMVEPKERLRLGKAMAEIATGHGMTVYSCLEGTELAKFGVNTGGCMTKEVLEHALGEELDIPSGVGMSREGCSCLLGNDIGTYNSCRHFCKYCYANYDRESVMRNSARHDPESPLLIGNVRQGDIIRDAKQLRYRTGQMRLTLK